MLLRRGLEAGDLSFHAEAAEAFPAAELIFLCEPAGVGDGEPHLAAIVGATVEVGIHAAAGAVLVNRTTAPIGTLRWIRALLEGRAGDITLATNPEFLMPGTAVADFLVPYRIVVGAWEVAAVDRVFEAFRPITERRVPPDLVTTRADRGRDATVPVFVTAPETAELSTYAAKALTAVRTSFVNEIAEVAERSGADIDEVVAILSLDPRIGAHLPGPGLGWERSSLPRDLQLLDESLETLHMSTRLLSGANEVNDDRAGWVQRKLLQHLRSIEGRTIVVMGPGAAPPGDRGRPSRALEVATDLARAGADVRAFDPEVRTSAGDDAGISVIDDALASAEQADAIVIASVWEGVTDLPLERLRTVMRRPLLVDGWNCVDERAARDAGLVYVGVGRRQPNVLPILPSPSAPEPESVASARRGEDDSRHPSPPAGPGGGVELAAPARHMAGAAAAAALAEEWVAVEQPHIEPIVLPEAGRSTSQWIQLGVKRVMDVVASLMMMVVLSPLLIAVAVAVGLDSRGPMLFVQQRLGRGGRPFSLVKFRTMVSGAAGLDECLEADPELLREWEERRKLRRDPRVTRVGQTLRRFSLDELPQLWNVLIGHMSLVGPRPVQRDELALLGPEGPEILTSRPGLTGLWAVSGRSDVSYRERAQLEFQYVVEWNLWLDLRILLRTIPAVIRGHGAY
jgi:exopolysaccharide production protein ExoY